jgi:glycosyltransferase involved in cell wall biosynthesis
MLKDLSIENDVILLEPVPREELPNYIAAANCVVVPSLSEGFGFTAAEACAMDKPVVVSNAGSLPEVVSGEWVLIEPRNTQAIADGVMKIARGETQHSAKKTFSWDECAQKYSQVYKDLTK